MSPLESKFRFRLRGRTLVLIDWANVHGWFSDLRWEIDPKRLFDYLSTYPEIFEMRLYQGIEVGHKRSEDFATCIRSIGFSFITKDVKFVPVSLGKSHFKEVIRSLFSVLDTIKITNTVIATKLFRIRQGIEERLSTIGKPNFDSDGTFIGEAPPYAQEDESLYNSTYDLIEELDVELKKLNLSITELQKNLSCPVMRRKCDFDVELARDVFNLADDFDNIILFSGDGDYAALADDLIAKNKKVILVFAPGHKGKEYKDLKRGLFLCSVHQLKEDIRSIPADFSTGRDASILPK